MITEAETVCKQTMAPGSRSQSAHTSDSADTNKLATMQCAIQSLVESTAEIMTELQTIRSELKAEHTARQAEHEARLRAEAQCVQLMEKLEESLQAVADGAVSTRIRCPPPLTEIASRAVVRAPSRPPPPPPPPSSAHHQSASPMDLVTTNQVPPPTYRDVVVPKVRWFNGADDILSNLHDCPIYAQGHYFSGSESLIQWRKARIMRDFARADQILQAKHAYTAMQIGRQVQKDQKWYDSMLSIVNECVRIKAQQYAPFREELLRTKDMAIRENTEHPIWGGRARSQCNAMGHILEQIRDDIRAGTLTLVDSVVKVTDADADPPRPNPAYSVRQPRPNPPPPPPRSPQPPPPPARPPPPPPPPTMVQRLPPQLQVPPQMQVNGPRQTPYSASRPAQYGGPPQLQMQHGPQQASYSGPPPQQMGYGPRQVQYEPPLPQYGDWTVPRN